MSCNEYRNRLHEYVSRNLCELESHALARHLKSCEKCRRELEEIKEIKAFLKFGIQENITPPADLKPRIMASINLRKYKNVYKNSLGELTNWGMSLVAAGLILLFINLTPPGNITYVQNEWGNMRENITEKVQQPLSSINEGLDKFTNAITQLDGITVRFERERKGGN